MHRGRGRTILARMSADIFIVIALLAVAVLSVAALAWTIAHFAAPGPPVDH